MNIKELLERLERLLDIRVEETRQLPTQRKTVYILVGNLPDFPSGRDHLWYSLVVDHKQDSVDREEIDAIRRHFWHLSTPFFDDELALESKQRKSRRKPTKKSN